MRLRQFTGSVAALIILGSVAFATPKAASAPESANIKKTIERLVKATSPREVNALAALYAEDVVIVPAHGDPIVGKQRAIDESRRASSDFRVHQSLSADEPVIHADTAFVRGTAHGWKLDRQTGTRHEFTESYVAVLRQECGKWRLTRLIWDDSDAHSKL